MAHEANAAPFGGTYSYGGSETTTTWDENKVDGCVCDSSWAVGYAAGETQATEWYGADCSMQRCPSGDDPRTAADETDCTWADANGAVYRGYIGSDGAHYASPGDMPTGVYPPLTPAPTAKQYGSIAPADVPNAGQAGNKCYVECSRRGTCDSSTGTCSCFTGYAGRACEIKSTLYS